jgi:hypothetical protein
VLQHLRHLRVVPLPTLAEVARVEVVVVVVAGRGQQQAHAADLAPFLLHRVGHLVAGVAADQVDLAEAHVQGQLEHRDGHRVRLHHVVFDVERAHGLDVVRRPVAQFAEVVPVGAGRDHLAARELLAAAVVQVHHRREEGGDAGVRVQHGRDVGRPVAHDARVHAGVVSGPPGHAVEQQESAVAGEHRLAVQQRQVHPVQRRAVAHDVAALAAVPVAPGQHRGRRFVKLRGCHRGLRQCRPVLAWQAVSPVLVGQLPGAQRRRAGRS